MKIEEALKLIGRKVLWNPESKCNGAGSRGIITGIEKDIMPRGLYPGEEIFINKAGFRFLISFESNPAATSGWQPEDKDLIILDERLEEE